MTPRSAFILLAMSAGLLSAASAGLATNTSTFIKPVAPRATVTPKPDRPADQLAVPQPATLPSCVVGKDTLYADSAGCLFACTSGTARKLSGTSCALPTPTATSTVTPTPTVTSTP